MASRAAAALLRASKWALGFALAFLALFVLVNAFDQDLEPEVAALFADPPEDAPERRNGYFLMVGLSAPSVDPHAAGAAYIDELRRAEEKRIAGERTVRWPDPLGSSPQLPGYCAMDGTNCLEQVAADAQAARTVVDEHRALLGRYRRLLDYPEYVETYRARHPESPLPAFMPLLAAQRAFFIEAALELRAGRADAVVADLEQSLALSRRMLAGSRTIIGKMVAAAHARRSAQFASQLLASRAAERKHARRLAPSLAPLSPEERRLGPALRAEFAMQLGALRDCDTQFGLRPMCFFLQPNATANLEYRRWYAPYLKLDTAPPEKLEHLSSALKAREAAFPLWSLLYNPVGKILSATASPDWFSYIARVHDVDALLRLVALQAAIVADAVPVGRIPEFAASAGPPFADPYTAAPMRWDAERRQLYFEPKVARMLQGGGVPGRFGVTF